jgi:hypothetical protein
LLTDYELSALKDLGLDSLCTPDRLRDALVGAIELHEAASELGVVVGVLWIACPEPRNKEDREKKRGSESESERENK